MYSPDPDRFNSPFLNADAGTQASSPIDSVRDAVSAHGKLILLVVALLAVGYFVADFFVLGMVPYSVSVANTEHEPVTSTISVYAAGQSEPLRTATATSVELQLKSGAQYRVVVSSGGYDAFDQSFSAGEEGVFAVVLSKAFKSTIKSVEFPVQAFLGTTVEGTVTLSNRGSKNESVELVFEGDWKDAVTGPTAPVLVPSGQDVPVRFSVSFDASTKIKNAKTGDSKKGTVRIRYSKAAAKTAEFTLLPAPALTVSPLTLSKSNVASGSQNVQVGTIKVTSNSDFAVPALSITVVTEDPSMHSWFSLSKTQLGPFAKRSDSDSVIVYVSPPASETDLSIAGSSKIVLSSEVFTKEIPLQVGVTKTVVALKPSLSTGTAAVQVAKTADGYEVKHNVEFRLNNSGDVALSNVDVVISPLICKSGGWVDFDSATTHFDSIDPRATAVVKVRVSAPQTAESGDSQTCTLRAAFDNPVTGDPSFVSSDLVVIAK